MDIQPAPSAGGDNTPASPAPPTPGREPHSFYEAVGGGDTFTRLVHRFYQLVADDPELRPVYPAKDLGPAEEHLGLFLIQYWGGPQTFNELRGHPRLRMRHARFVYRRGRTGRPGWVTCGPRWTNWLWTRRWTRSCRTAWSWPHTALVNRPWTPAGGR